MRERFYRIVDGVEERLCWRFLVHGRLDPAYEPADGDRGPFDPDRRRRLQRGETFQRLDRSGRPRVYQGLSWRPVTAPIVDPDEGLRANGSLLQSELRAAEHQLNVAERELADAVHEVPAVPRAEKTLTSDRVAGALDGVKESRAKLQELQLELQAPPEQEP